MAAMASAPHAIARQALASVGVERVYGGTYCTHTDAERFYSYRRDGETGRMATVIWICLSAMVQMHRRR